MPTVRTRFQPTVDLEVPAAEAAALRAQGLLVEDTPAPETGSGADPAPAATKTAAAVPSGPAQNPASDDPKGD